MDTPGTSGLAPAQPSGVEGPSAPDTQLMSRIARGDQKALEELYERYASFLHGLVARLVHDPADQEEVLQETFLAVWRRAATYDGRRGRLSSWLFSIAHHKAVDLMRRSRRTAAEALGELGLDSQPAVGSEAPADVVADQAQLLQLREAVLQALNQLRPEERQVVVLAYFHGYTHREIATYFSIPLGTVKSRMRTALQRLRALLDARDTGMTQR